MQTKLHNITFSFPRRFITILIFTILGFTTIAQEATTYNEAIIYGDRKMSSSKLMDAKAYYQQALKIKPGDDYAKSQIIIIVDKMKMAMAAEDEYYDIIDLGDELYDENKLTQAINQYKKAIVLIPNDEYALSKIREIEEFQNNEQEKIETFDKAMATGKVYVQDGEYDKAIIEFRDAVSIFPAKESPINELSKAQQLKSEFEEKESKFEIKFEEAERYMLIKNFVKALELFKDAEAIMPENKNAISKINQVSPLAEKEINFNKMISEADEYYISQDFISAQRVYSNATELWPEKSYPSDMITKITEKLENEKVNLESNYNQYIISGDSMMLAQEYSLALGKYNLALNLKPEESYPKSKVDEIESIFAQQRNAFEDNYNSMIANADSLFNTQSYNAAKDKYETALTVKTDDPYPKSRLAEIEKIFEIKANEDKANAEYNSIVKQADDLYKSGNYELAIKKYRVAQALKSIENYPASKINTITLLLENAAKQKQIDEKYNELVLVAVQKLNQNKLVEARQSYVNASEIKPNELLPKQQITTIDSLIIVEKREAELKQEFDKLLAEGDTFKESKEYESALQKYDEALLLLPNENIAKTKKQEVVIIQKNIRKEAERKKSYEGAIDKGDKLFDEGSFELSRVEFQKAQSLRKDQEYPRQRLNDISKELERLEAEKEERYAQSISDADVLFDQGRYEDALKKYQVAISIKPLEKHPQQRITECNGYVAEKIKRLFAEYEVALADADKFYNSKTYDKAIAGYKKAELIKPDETYPAQMVDKITKYIEENSIVDIIATSDTVNAKVLDKFTFEPVKINVRKSNYIIMKARSIDGEPCKLIISYGSDGSKNGGFVIQVSEGKEYNDYLVRVGNQYKWFSEDNNWISIYPENGDIEVSMLRISKGY